MGNRLWLDLPEPVRDAVEQRCGGPVDGVSYPSAGRHSEFSASIRTRAGLVFVKGSPTDSPNTWMHEREVRVNGYLPPLAPRLLWTIDRDGWRLLGCEHVAGHHVDLAPHSIEVPRVAEAVATLSDKLTPCPVDVPTMADHWARLSAWRRLRDEPPGDLDDWSRGLLARAVDFERQAFDVVRGNSLLHTDLHALNMLAEDSGAVRIIDWAWSRKGAAWVDAAFLVIRLVDSGHEPAAAENLADRVSAWANAPSAARSAFAVAVLGIWEYLQRARPLPHRAKLTDSARTWARYRLDR